MLGQTISPFWQRFSSFFCYPLAANSLIFLLFLTIAAATAFNSNNFYLQIIVGVSVAGVLVKYLFSLLLYRAHGYKDSPAVKKILLNNQGYNFIRQLALLVIIFSVQYLVLFGNNAIVATEIALLLLNFLLPACIILIAIENSLFKALNPFFAVALINKVGRSYFIAFAVAALIFIGLNSSIDWFGGYLQPELLIFLSFFIFFYLLSVVFNMLGFMVYQHHHELGYVADIAFINYDSNLKIKDDVVVTAEELIINGEIKLAAKTLRLALIGNPYEIGIHEKYHKILHLLNNHNAIVEHAKLYIIALLKSRHGAKAVTLFKQHYTQDKNFKLDDPIMVLELAKNLRHFAERKLAIVVLHRFHERCDSIAVIAEAYLLMAKTLADGLNKDEEAKKVLNFIIKHYPYSPAVVEAKQYLEMLQRL